MLIASTLRGHVVAELALARAATRDADVGRAWKSLERAHILSQPLAGLHSRVHFEMLLLALRVRDWREATGQLLRLAVAGVGSLTGRFPVGNTGRATVSLTQPMPIPEDVAKVLAACAPRARSE
jgi:hypothetical protein